MLYNYSNLPGCRVSNSNIRNNCQYHKLRLIIIVKCLDGMQAVPMPSGKSLSVCPLFFLQISNA